MLLSGGLASTSMLVSAEKETSSAPEGIPRFYLKKNEIILRL